MITTETILIGSAGGLAIVSLLAMVWLGVFAARPLVLAPPRHSALSLLHVGGVLALYLFSEVVALLATGYQGPGKGETLTIEQITHSQGIDGLARIMIIGVMIVLARFLTRDRLDGWGLSLKRLPKGLALGYLATALIAAPIFLILAGTEWAVNTLHREPPMHDVLRILLNHPPMVTSFILVFGAAILAPVAEELFFRGILQTALIQRNPFGLGIPSFSSSTGGSGFPLYPGMPPVDPASELPASPSAGRRWLAIVITASVFALIHGQIEFIPVLLVLALALGYLYERTGNLWAPITLHAAFNCTMLFMTLSPPTAT